MSSDVNIDSLLISGQSLKAEIRDAITEAKLTRTIDSSPTLAVTIEDKKRVLLKSGYFVQRLTAQVDDHSFELAQLNKSGNKITLTMEDLAVAELRRHNTVRKASAGTVTRVQFVQQILASETPWIKLYVDPSVKEPVATVELARGSVQASSDANGDPNYYSAGGAATTSTGTVAPSTTTGNLTPAQIAGVAAAAGFSGTNLVIAVAVSLAESAGNPNATNKNRNGSTDYGLWQINSVHANLLNGVNWADPQTNARMAFTISGGTNWQPWATFNSGAYKKFLAQAQTAAGSPDVNFASNTTSTSSDGTVTSLEDSWTCFKRIFSEVNWRLYADKGNLYAGPDSAFIDKTPAYVFHEFDQGVDMIDFDWDVGKAVATATIKCRATRWVAPPGSVIALPDFGLPEKWIVSSITRSLFSEQTTLVVKSPEPELPEPHGSDANGDTGYYGDPTSSAGATTGAQGGASDGKYIWPISGLITVNSPFGATVGRNHVHQGIDLAAKDGTPVYASRAGTVTKADNSDPSGYGNCVYITHRSGDTDKVVGPVASGDETRYAHLSSFTCRPGLQVSQGQQIGLSGHTGDATGPHVHFEIRVNGVAVNPQPLVSSGPKSAIPSGTTQVQISSNDVIGNFFGENNKIPLIP